MPTTEKGASLLVAMLRGTSDRPWRQAMLQGLGMHVMLRGASDRPWCVKPWHKDLECMQRSGGLAIGHGVKPWRKNLEWYY